MVSFLSGSSLRFLSILLGCPHEFLLENPRRRWPFSFKGQLEMADDPFHFSIVVEEDDNAHPPAS